MWVKTQGFPPKDLHYFNHLVIVNSLVLVLVQETRVLPPRREIEIGYDPQSYTTPISPNV